MKEIFLNLWSEESKEKLDLEFVDQCKKIVDHLTKEYSEEAIEVTSATYKGRTYGIPSFNEILLHIDKFKDFIPLGTLLIQLIIAIFKAFPKNDKKGVNIIIENIIIILNPTNKEEMLKNREKIEGQDNFDKFKLYLPDGSYRTISKIREKNSTIN